MQKWATMFTEAAKAFANETEIDAPAPDGVIRHFHAIHTNSREMHLLKMMSNIETASMHLRYLSLVIFEIIVMFCLNDGHIQGHFDLPSQKKEFLTYLKWSG